jgi:predicted MFS family arabinose efflux permease
MHSIFFVLGGMAVVALATAYWLLPETLPPLEPGAPRPRFPNPLAAFTFFRYAGVAVASLATSLHYAAFYCLVVAIPSAYTDVRGVPRAD